VDGPHWQTQVSFTLAALIAVTDVPVTAASGQWQSVKVWEPTRQDRQCWC
jgi:hypothetical protein